MVNRITNIFSFSFICYLRFLFRFFNFLPNSLDRIRFYRKYQEQDTIITFSIYFTPLERKNPKSDQSFGAENVCSEPLKLSSEERNLGESAKAAGHWLFRGSLLAGSEI